MSPVGASDGSEVHRLALEKMSAVLGAERAQRLLRSILAELGIELDTPQDLYRFSVKLASLGGFEGAVGAMLSVAAVMRGATPPSPTRSPGDA